MLQFKATIPAEWRNDISPCTKYSDNTAGGSSAYSNVTSTTDDIFLLAEWEVEGARTYANSAEKDYQQQYDYYKNGNSAIFYNHSETDSPCYWWTRSASGNSSTFCAVMGNGNINRFSATNSFGLAPAFMVGGNAA